MKKTTLTVLIIFISVFINAQEKANHNTTRSNQHSGIMVKDSVDSIAVIRNSQKQNEKEIQILGDLLNKLKIAIKNTQGSSSKSQIKVNKRQYIDLLNKFEDITKQYESVIKKHSILQDNFESLTKEANDCKIVKDKIDANLIKEQKEKKECQIKLKELNSKVNTLNKNNNAQKLKIEQYTKEYKNLQKAYNSEKEQYQNKLKEHNSKIDTLNKNNNAQKLKIEQYTKEYEDLQKDYNSEKEHYQNEKKELNAKIEELSKDIEFDIRPMPVSKVYTNIVDEIQKSETLNTSNFKLSNIQLKIKALVNRDKEGMNFQFLNHENAKEINGNSISEVIIDIESSPRAVVNPGNLPNLIGFTETAVRRILSNLDMRLNPVYQKNMKVPSGESFKQSPALNSIIQKNQLITVIFSKNE